jgi:hypothetical protein
MEKAVYTKLSMKLLRTLENHSTIQWYNKLSPTKFFPNLANEDILVFAWESGELTWSWRRDFNKREQYERVKPDEFIRWCVRRFPKE